MTAYVLPQQLQLVRISCLLHGSEVLVESTRDRLSEDSIEGDMTLSLRLQLAQHANTNTNVEHEC